MADTTNSLIPALIAAPFTPMHSDGSINLAMVATVAKSLSDEKVAGVFVNGTTGEGISLSTDERIQIAEEWVRVTPRPPQVIIHVGHQSVAEARRLASHAQDIKAHGLASMAPSFFRPSTVEQLVDFCAQIAEAAPGLPFYYYHFPAMTGVDFPMIDFLKGASRRIPNLKGIKFTHENLMDYNRCLHFEKDRFQILFGRDEMLLAAVAMGARAVVGSTYNFMAPLYHQMLGAFKTGDLDKAQRLQSAAIEIIAIMARHGGLPAGKAIMKMIGLDCGPVRSPLQNLTGEKLSSLERELKSAGFPLSRREAHAAT